MKMFRVPAVVLKIFAEVENKIIDRTGGGVYIIAPYYLQYMLARYHFVFVLYEQFQQGGFFFAQFLYIAVFVGTLMRAEVDTAAAKLINIGYSLRFFDLFVLY